MFYHNWLEHTTESQFRNGEHCNLTTLIALTVPRDESDQHRKKAVVDVVRVVVVVEAYNCCQLSHNQEQSRPESQ